MTLAEWVDQNARVVGIVLTRRQIQAATAALRERVWDYVPCHLIPAEYRQPGDEL
jgi:hypothetical protein